MWRMHFCFVIIIFLITAACSSVSPEQHNDQQISDNKNGDDFFIVDCLLPGQVRKLGGQFSFITARRPIKTSASNCEIRGGEYVAHDRADYATALKLWLPLAKEGDAEAQAYVGEIYEKGLGLTPDFLVAAYWYQKAAEQQLARAQINLGHLYEKGLGVEQNIVKALELYRMASGLTSDQLTFASSLQASYVPRKEFRELNQKLGRSLKEQEKINKQKNQYEKKIKSQNKALLNSKSDLKETQETLKNLLLSPPVQTEQFAHQKEQDLLKKIQSLDKQQSLLQKQIEVMEINTDYINQQKQQLEISLREKQQAESVAKTTVTSTQEKLNDYAQNLDQLKQEIIQLNKTLKALTSTKDSAIIASQAEAQSLENEISVMNRARAQQQLQYDEIQQQYKQQKQQLEISTRQLNNQQNKAAQELTSFQSKQQEYQLTIKQKEHEVSMVHAQRKSREKQLKHSLAEKQSEVEQLSSEHQLDISDYDLKIAKLTKQLQTQQTQVNDQKQQISNLQTDLQSFQISTLSPTAAGSLFDDAPSIEIIEPPVTLTRSTPTVKLVTQQDYRDVIGKISAPAGLLSLTVNGERKELEDYSLFKASIPIVNEVTPVEIVAIDSKGRRVAVKFSMLSQDKESVTQAVPAKITYDLPPLGTYYALIIGNNNYQSMSTLATAVNDAKEAEKILGTKYKFKTQLLIDASRYQILSALNQLREKLTTNDNLLIYYAGHGKLDTINKRGFWLPVDADETNNANWISNTDITDILNSMEAKHVMVVADSCYSGSLSQTALSRADQTLTADVKKEWIKVMANTRARIMLTSGGLEPVLDGGGGNHSIFAKAFLDTLKGNNEILDGYSLYYEVLTKVMENASKLDREQVPQYAPIHLAGHESGEFLFSPVL